MTDLLEKRLETFINIAIIATAVVLIGVIGYKFLRPPEFLDNGEIKIGQDFSLSEVDWDENKKTLVLVLQEDCHFCNESAAFYIKIVERSKNTNPIKLIAVFPTSNETAKSHLKKQGVEINDIRQINPETFQVRGTPTLVLVNEKGKVIDSWVGKLLPEDEEKVLQRIL